MVSPALPRTKPITLCYTILYYTLQYSTVKDPADDTVLYYTVLYSTVQYRTLPITL